MKNNLNLKWKGSLLLGALMIAAAMPLALKAASNSVPAASEPSAVIMTVTAAAKKNAVTTVREIRLLFKRVRTDILPPYLKLFFMGTGAT